MATFSSAPISGSGTWKRISDSTARSAFSEKSVALAEGVEEEERGLPRSLLLLFRLVALVEALRPPLRPPLPLLLKKPLPLGWRPPLGLVWLRRLDEKLTELRFRTDSLKADRCGEVVASRSSPPPISSTPAAALGTGDDDALSNPLVFSLPLLLASPPLDANSFFSKSFLSRQIATDCSR